MTTSVPSFRPGDIRTRAEIYRELGGTGGTGGIVPSISKKTVLLFSDAQSGEKLGYRDGWLRDQGTDGPIFMYTGAGQIGDQTLTKVNKSVLQHREEGRTLHLFIRHGKIPNTDTKTHRYIGAFELAEDPPYKWRRARDKEGDERDVVVFRLRPTGEYNRLKSDDMPLPRETRPLRFLGRGRRSPAPTFSRGRRARDRAAAHAVPRQAQTLVSDLSSELISRNQELMDLEVHARGRQEAMEAALYNASVNTIYEPTNDTTHREVLEALMKLADISRYLSEPHNGLPLRCMILTPDEPDEDIRDLLAHQGVGLIYRNADGSFTELPLDTQGSTPPTPPLASLCADCPQRSA
ncbi:hypothetical protein H9Y04_31670 [Streptomyces sp. TRM66268-LWL]|uniref:ScoMcrA-like SRA domain-containing protein n=1 Tax=Streptomyces polyasparticus TaxID=2767826 RepID=A0ABR7SQZ8_9ACTN|nr:hypothetical protein [Streptomyces polyasparticus]MBC9717100.1 hypothetical protein [Streptomyces polyasparticus]